MEVMSGPRRTVVSAKIVYAIITSIQVPAQDPKDNKKGAPPIAATIAEQPLAESAKKMPATSEFVYNPKANDAIPMGVRHSINEATQGEHSLLASLNRRVLIIALRKLV